VDNQGNHQAARIFAGGFAESLAESLTGAAGLPWQVKILDNPDPSAQEGQAIQFRLTLEGALHGDFLVEFYAPQVTELASQICGHSVQAFSDEHGEALGKVLSSAMAGFSTSLSAQYGAPTFKIDREAGLATGEMLVIPLVASRENQSGMPVTLYFDGQLLAALSSEPATRDAAEAENPAIDPANLKLVLDVELNVSLRFGQRQLPLREVLELASGSVIELDRQVDDPVELLLDGKVIARGEAVIVDGNYGLRVTEICQPIASHFIR
jgi:flagellar motor switch protein FliN/FliY